MEHAAKSPSELMGSSRRRLAPINQPQKKLLIEFLKNNEDLQAGRFTAEFTFKTAKGRWEEITNTLNAVPGGAHKNWKQWRKTWQDLKKSTKSKTAQIKKMSTATGGGPPPKPLENEDLEILNMITSVVLEGHDTLESEANFEFEEPEHPAPTRHDEETSNVEEDHHGYALKEPNETLPKRTKIMSKTRRLENSLALSQNVLRVIEDRKNEEAIYHQEKIKFMKYKMKYYQEKLAVLKNMADIQQEVLNTLREIKPHLQNL